MKKFNMRVFVIIVCAIMSLAIVSAVLGRPFRLKKLPDEGRNFGCGTCHVNPGGGGEKTTFGKDYEKIAIKAGDKYTEELGKLDSDGDGFTNDQEFDSATNPGDPESKPAGDADAAKELARAIEKGKALFNDTKLGKSGTSCNTCHVDGGTNGGQVMGMDIPTLKGAAATFPKYKKMAKRVITLSQMNNICIETPLQGKPLKLDSDEAIALAAYVTSLSEGKPIQMGRAAK